MLRKKAICIIGSGPAGFCTAQKLLRIFKDAGIKNDLEIDILERSRAPYGLIRYGVAPDHPEVKVSIPFSHECIKATQASTLL
jgi:cation diffusion facilitator CzcD-associated flavoprotein CzcO